MDRDLARLAREHAVALHAGTRFLGSGFLAAPDTVLTCAHVVAAAHGAPVTVTAGLRTAIATDAVLVPSDRGPGEYHAFPDLARLTLAESIPAAGVWLAAEEPAEEARVVVYGFSRHTPAEEPGTDTLGLTIVGQAGEYFRVTGDQVVHGFSGGPVLDRETGRVCGVMKATRDQDDVKGGWIIPATVVAGVFPDLAEASAVAHRPGTRWFDLARGAKRRQREIFGRDAAGRARTPAGLLVAAQEIVPFEERAELEALRKWCEDDESDHGVVRLVHAPGGTGKTRLAAHLCGWLRRGGWLAGFVTRPDPAGVQAARITEALDAGFAVLAVVDYAQDRLDVLHELMSPLARDADPEARLRVLLLARSATPWWDALLLERASEYDWILYHPSVTELTPLTETFPAEQLAERAFRAFAGHLGHRMGGSPRTLPVAARGHPTVLEIHALALDAVLTLARGATWRPDHDPLSRICGHEAAIFRRALGRHGAPVLSGRILPEALLLAPALLDGDVSDSVLSGIIEAVDPGAGLNWKTVRAALSRLYGRPDGPLTPVEPDRITEILARAVFRALAEPDAAAAYLRAVAAEALKADGESALVPVFRVLARARGCTVTARVEEDDSYPVLDTAVGLLLAAAPERVAPVLVEVGSVLPHAAPLAAALTMRIDDFATELLRSLEPRLPRYATELSGFAALVYRRLLSEHRGEEELEARLHRAHLLTQASLRFGETAVVSASRAAAEEAVVICAELVRDGGDRYGAQHAASLNNLSLRLKTAGDLDGAVRTCMEAERTYRRLEAAPDGAHDHRIDLAATLANLAALLHREQPAAAVHLCRDSVALYRRLVPEPRQEDGLVKALGNLAVFRADVGEFAAGLADSGAAVGLYRSLAERNPGRYLLNLIDARQIHAGLLACQRPRRLSEAYAEMSRVVVDRADFLADAVSVLDREELLDKQYQAVRLLGRWADELPEYTGRAVEWAKLIATLEES